MLASPEWTETFERDLLPRVTAVAHLGECVFEMGPGPGLRCSFGVATSPPR